MFMSAHVVPADPPAGSVRRRRLRLVPVLLPPTARRRAAPRAMTMADLGGVVVPAVVLVPPAPGIVLALAWWCLLAATGCHERRLLGPVSGGLRTLARAALGMVVVAEVASAVAWPGWRGPMLVSVAATTTWLLADRLVSWEWQRREEVTRTPRTVLVGARVAVQDWLDQARIDPRAGVEVVAACVLGEEPGPDPDPWAREVPTAPTMLGIDHADMAAVADAVAAYAADTVLVVPCAQMPPAEIRRLAWCLESSPAELLVAPGLPDVVPRRATLTRTGTVSVLHVRRAELTGWRRLLKDVLERGLALAALVVISPVLLALIALIRLDSPGSAIYRQCRVGKNGRPFTMLKLRTMVADAELHTAELAAINDADGVLFKVRADPRITRLGQALRRYSLDELPQLWNVVRGDMALVGPRPALPDEVARYAEDMRRRMVVKPGLTGLWQVSGRSDLSWERAMQLDLHYVDNWSLGLDAAIMLRTVHAVLAHAGAY